MLAFLSVGRLNRGPVSLGFKTHLGFHQSYTLLPLARCLSSSRDAVSDDDFTVSYLKNSCGLSLESAKSVSKRVSFDGPERPDSVLNLLRSQGFTNAHISSLVRQKPNLLLANPEKRLLPKIEFFRSVGASDADIAQICSAQPNFLCRSLHNFVIPFYNIIKSVVLLDEKVIVALKRTSRFAVCDPEKKFLPNIALLRRIGVPQSSIVLFVSNFCTTAFFKHSRFQEIVEEVKQMGFDPLKSVFVLAINVIAKIPRAKLKHRLELYRKWGWSQEEALLAFKKHPHCLILSEEKITIVMDFLVREMCWPAEVVARTPHVLLLGFEKRIVPRCSVVQVLLQRGLIKNVALAYFLNLKEELFMKNFIKKYEYSVPQLLSVYKGQGDLNVGVEFVDESK